MMEAPEEIPAILLLERDNDVIEAARRAMRREAELHVANSLELALRIAERRPLVVAVLDATMAGLSPTDTVSKLRAYHPNLRIIFLAVPTVALDRRYGQIGPVLRKPVTVERFGEAIRYALRLQNMSVGIRRLRESSGSYRAVRPPSQSEQPPAEAAPPSPRSAPPSPRSTPPEPPPPPLRSVPPPPLRSVPPPGLRDSRPGWSVPPPPSSGRYR